MTEIKVQLDSGVELTNFNSTINKGSSDDDDKVSIASKRNEWSNYFDFIFSIIGFAVDLANVFRFPYICYRNGGGAFLIPYFVMLILTAIPVFYMELVFGQYMRCGGLNIWKLCPILKGVGYASILLTVFVALFYNVIIAWAIYYFYASFSFVLPWTRCDQYWNTPNCITNITNLTSSVGKVDSATEFFENRVLKIDKSSGIGDLGSMNWELTLALFIQYVFLFLCLFKGVKVLGKAVWITSILPYVILLALLINGLFLEGSMKGIEYFVTPTFERLAEFSVWLEAASQIFFSIGVGFSVHIAYASYNDFNSNILRTCLIATLVNSFTSLFAGFVIFSYIGYLSIKFSKDIKLVTSQNPAMIFMVYPQALATLPFPQFWSVMFFLMLLCLGLDSSFGALESFLTAVMDNYGFIRKKLPYPREILTGVLMMCLFLLSLPNTTCGGFYLIQILDKYSAGVSLLVVSLFEVIGFIWVFGIGQSKQMLEKMNRTTVPIAFRILIKFITPVLLLSVILSQLVGEIDLTVEIKQQKYQFPTWSYVLGYIIQLSSILLIPTYGVIKFIAMKRRSNLKEKLALAISPEWEHNNIKIDIENAKRLKMKHWIEV